MMIIITITTITIIIIERRKSLESVPSDHIIVSIRYTKREKLSSDHRIYT